MIERKRRNDFVRKREFDMLRKVRREGLTERAARRPRRLVAPRRLRAAHRRQPAPPGRRRQGQDRRDRAADGRRQLRAARSAARPSSTTRRPSRRRSTSRAAGRAARRRRRRRSRRAAGSRISSRAGRRSPPRQPPRRHRAGRGARRPRWRRSSSTRRAERLRPGRSPSQQSEVTHDPDLDEAVIAFANADFEQCEQALVGADRPRRRARAACRDLAGAVRPVPRDRPAAQVREPGARLRAAVRLVGAAVVLDAASWSPRRPARSGRAAPRIEGQVGWVCPDYLDADGVAKLALAGAADAAALGVRLGRAADDRRRGLRPPVRAVPQLDPAGPRHALALAASACSRCSQEAAPTGVRDADPAYWQLRLDALRMTNRPDQFDEAAIDYCVTYEVSPPSWEPAQLPWSASAARTRARRSRRCRW